MARMKFALLASVSLAAMLFASAGMLLLSPQMLDAKQSGMVALLSHPHIVWPVFVEPDPSEVVIPPGPSMTATIDKPSAVGKTEDQLAQVAAALKGLRHAAEPIEVTADQFEQLLALDAPPISGREPSTLDFAGVKVVVADPTDAPREQYSQGDGNPAVADGAALDWLKRAKLDAKITTSRETLEA